MKSKYIPYEKEIPINIFKNTWYIKVVKSELDIPCSSSKEAVSGICSPRDYKIYIATSCNVTYFKQTFYHEICHAFMYETGNFERDFTNEEVCDFLGIIGTEMQEVQKILDILLKIYF